MTLLLITTRNLAERVCNLWGKQEGAMGKLLSAVHS
jgi:hypothetical protein